MSTAPVENTYSRQPLGLPAGSIRAILSVGIAAAFLLYLGHPKATHVPLYLHFLTFGLFLFFASHGRTIGTAGRSPLYLPRGTLRFLIVAAIFGTVGWLVWQNPQEVMNRMRPTEVELQSWAPMFAASVIGFFAGWLLSIGPWRNAAAFQDVLAWISLVALFMMLAEALWKGFIDPQGIKIENRYIWESLLIGVVTFYFGSRS
ncbi:MAG TPA: hypothetical protein PKA06_14405 [Gemmatales bacterium]|nr:hypothetical protein [Gemmatales bacterium]HMP15664.1 hypothetical protein [Gemmatales bacterium]